MDKFTTLEGVAAPLKIINVDTDMIIPKQYLKTIKRTGLGKGLFGRTNYAMMAKATTSGGARRISRPRAWLCTLLFAGVTFIALLPHLGVILVAFAHDWYGTVLPPQFTLENFRLALGHDLTVPAIANNTIADPIRTHRSDVPAAIFKAPRIGDRAVRIDPAPPSGRPV